MNEINNIKFLSGGNAILTVGNNKGEHYTYKIKQPKGENKPYFVNLLTGPDNTSDYTYVGIFNPSDLSIRLTTKSKLTDESTPVKVIRWAVKMIGRQLPNGYTIQHEGRCCRCGRTLTTPESIDNGIGPECIKFWNN